MHRKVNMSVRKGYLVPPTIAVNRESPNSQGQARYESESDTWFHPFPWQWAKTIRAAKPTELQDKPGDGPPQLNLGRNQSARSEQSSSGWFKDHLSQNVYLRLDVVNITDDDIDDPLGKWSDVPKKKHHGDDSAGHLTSTLPPMAPSPALADTPRQEKAKGNEVHEEHFASGHHLGCDCVGAHPRGGVEVDVEEEDDDGEEEGYEDRHPTQDVQQGPHHCTQSTD